MQIQDKYNDKYKDKYKELQPVYLAGKTWAAIFSSRLIAARRVYDETQNLDETESETFPIHDLAISSSLLNGIGKTQN